MNVSYCSDQFWDAQKTWYNHLPEFTSCFEDIILVTAPSLFFNVIFFISLCVSPKRASHHELPWSWLNVSKMLCLLVLLYVNTVLCGMNVYHHIHGDQVPMSTLVAAISRALVFILVAFSMYQHKRNGKTTSYVLCFFWIVFLLLGVVEYRSTILHYFVFESESPNGFVPALHLVYFPLIVIQFLFSLLPDKKHFNILHNVKLMEEVSLIPVVFFFWFTRIIFKSRRKLLEVTDLAFQSVKLTSSCTYFLFARHWNLNLIPKFVPSQSLAWALVKAFWHWCVYAIICDIIAMMMTVVPSLILAQIIDFVSHDTYVWQGYFLAILLFTVDLTTKTFFNQFINFSLNAGYQFMSALMGVVYRKNFYLSTSSRKKYASGALMSLLSVDIRRFEYLPNYTSSLLSTPFKIALTIYILWQYLGLATLSGLGVIMVLLPISFVVARYGQKFVEKQMKIKDIRLKLMNEILNGIKILKFYAWEIPYTDKIKTARKEEMQQIKYNLLCFLAVNLTYFCSPILVSIACFGTYLHLHPDTGLSPSLAFVSITLINQLRGDIFFFPDAISELIQANVSLKRLKNLLTSENKELSIIGNSPGQGKVLSIKKASLAWTEDAPCVLNEISLEIEQGKLVAIIGLVGAGKSSLISSVLGELYKITGSIDVAGDIAYVPQQAWILNRTVKENILLSKKVSDSHYNKILDFCCMRPDLEIFVAGDKTEIGEKGVNLSGGQKQRVSLARAVCQDKELYLLDDPLSAVDVHVRKALFNDVISNNGLLKDKTRILVTHEVTVLPEVDWIISMKDGRIDEAGTYNELISKKGSFTAFIEEHSNMTVEISGDNTLTVQQDCAAKDDHTCVIEIGHNLSIQDDCQTKEGHKLIQDEKMEEGEVSYVVYWRYMKQVGFLTILCVLLGYMLNVATEAYANIWLSHWSLDETTNSTHNDTTNWRLTVYGLLGLGDIIAVIIGSGSLAIGSITASVKFHNKMLSSIIKSPMSFFDCTPMGRIYNRFSSDMDVMDLQLFYKYDVWLTCFLSSLGAFIVIGMNTPYFLLALVPLFVVYYSLQRLHLNALRQIRRLESTARSPIYSHFLESIQGVSSICAFNLENEFIENFEEKMDKNIVCSFNGQTCNRWLNFFLDALGSIILLITTVLAINFRNTLNPAIVGLMLSYAIQSTSLLKWVVRMSTELEDKSISIERIEEYCRLKPEAPFHLKEDDNLENWPHEGNILFENYSTRYREELDLVLKELSLSINACEKVGIVGRTGAGKSSITLALFRIIEPIAGKIVIDSVDVSKVGLHKLRSSLTIIPQDPVLFIGSLRSNLDPNNEYKDDQLWVSLEQAHLKNFVCGLEKGIEHELDEGGSNLSTGQRQLVCLARALLKNSRILILDEATASVDMETDSLIQSTIRTAFANCTVITVAHRVHTIIDYDKILVMDEGRFVEIGNPKDLQQDVNSKFHAMCRESGIIKDF